MTVVLLNVKGAFDYVSKTQLLNVIKQLKLPYQLIQWIKSFMKNRKINLLFDDNKNKFFDIESRIFQNSSISSILYFIYVRKIHPQIRMQMAKSWSFIDDIVVYLNSKSVKSNCQTRSHCNRKNGLNILKFFWIENWISILMFKNDWIQPIEPCMKLLIWWNLNGDFWHQLANNCMCLA